MSQAPQTPGLYLFSAGNSWERAFTAALDFLQKTDGLLVLGPRIGASAQEWLAEESLQNPPLRLGARTQDWQKWVEGRARNSALSEGRQFRFLNTAKKRNLFRSAVKTLVTVEGFFHLQDIWEEPRFFDGLLGCVEEARMAGLMDDASIERAQSLLVTGSDNVTREAYQDFWHLLKLYERTLAASENYDFPAALKSAAELNGTEQSTFFLGFDKWSLLEVDLVQNIARDQAVYVPLALGDAAIESILKGQAPESDLTSVTLLRGLVTNFPGKISHLRSKEKAAIPCRYLLDAHVPSEEARAAAALASQAIAEGKQVRFLAASDAFADQGIHAAFAEELALPRNFAAKKTLDHPVALLFLHALELKRHQYSLARSLELAQLLQFSLGKFGEIGERASRAGIRRGLREWKEKAAERNDPLLAEFAQFLGTIHDLLPESGTATLFAESMLKLAKLCGVGEFARLAPELEIEREAHAAISSWLRNAKVLASSVEGTLSFGDWLAELKSLLEESQAGEILSFFPRLQFYRYGEWLPPADDKTVTIALGWNSGIEPRRAFCFYFEESARRKLSDLLLLSQAQEELSFLDQMERISLSGQAIFSWSRHDSRGNELQPSWISAALPLQPKAWPELARKVAVPPFRAHEKVLVANPDVPKFSASLLERYKECPFLAFAEKVLRLEDKIQPLSLDLSPMEEGNIVHRALELFYGEHKGKNLPSPEARLELLQRCLNQAVSEQKVDYFKGGEELKRNQVERLRRLLANFLEEDARYYELFPYFRDPDVEKKVSGSLGEGLPWEGKVDRVDVDETNRRFVVSDYKLGATTPTSLELDSLERFQLQLYLDAMEKQYPGFEPAGGLYVSLKTGKRNQGLVRKEFNQTKKTAEPGQVKYFKFGGTSKALKTDEEFAILKEDSLAEAKRLALEIRSGRFDVTPLDEETSCKRCEVRPACRIRELRAPMRQPWERSLPDFSELYSANLVAPEAGARRAKGLNPQQQEAIEREGQLVFIEASAGTGKTTVIVEKIRSFLVKRLGAGEKIYKAAEKFAAISFTEKSAKELSARVSQALVGEGGLGVKVAAQAIQQISTIHGFCRRLLNDFPVEAGIGPMATLMDEREAEALRQEIFEEFFLNPPESARASLAGLFAVFSRQKIENCLRRLLESRLLLAEDLSAYKEWVSGVRETLGERVEPGLEKERLRELLELGEIFAGVFDAAKRARDLLDFNDLEALSLKVLGNPEVQKYYRDRFELLLVDEFQDTNSVQRQILEKIARPGWANLFVVGDAKQSIYRFRAADVSVFQTLRAEAESAGSLVALTKNYRSRKELVEMANRVSEAIFPAAGKGASFEAVAAVAEAHRETGGIVRVVEYGDPEEKLSAKLRRSTEAEIVAELVKEKISGGAAASGIAILLRKISGNEAYLQALTRAGIPFRVGSSRGFYSQQVVLDGIALLRSFYGANNDLALLACLRSPWIRMPDFKIHEIQRRGSRSTPLWESLREEDAPQLFLWRRLASFLSCSELLARALETYPLDRREHLQTVKLLAIIQALEADAVPRVEIIERLSNWSGWEREEDSLDDSTMPEPGAGGAVQIMTVHAAKGLEFDLTILPDLSSGLLPDASPLRTLPGFGVALKLEDDEEYAAHKILGEKNKERELAESKRLLYVALTRAKEEAILILPKMGESFKPKKESWAEQIRAAKLADTASWESWKPGEVKEVSPKEKPPTTNWQPISARLIPFRANISISEISAFKNCAEFHRLKFVQGWDDQVKDLWPLPPEQQKKRAVSAGMKKRIRSDELLKALGLERKERGIALHRVLERIQNPDKEMEFAKGWLVEAYEAQGAKTDNVAFRELLEIDLALLRKFLDSAVGKDLFGPGVKAYPEIPFEWRLGQMYVHGVLDRLIQRKDGSWVVVDYKSSVFEDERGSRQRFQVASYMAAIAAYASAKEGKAARVTGFLVDLNEAESVEVIADANEAAEILAAEIEKIRENYTLADGKTDPALRGIRGGDECFSCPYSLHCDLGRKIVLEFI
ncbi:MAG: PD-(D/E)XK nuclease family protein [Bacteriovoracia bacterium]